MNSAVSGRHLAWLELPSPESGELPATQRMCVTDIHQTCSATPAPGRGYHTWGLLPTLDDWQGEGKDCVCVRSWSLSCAVRNHRPIFQGGARTAQECEAEEEVSACPPLRAFTGQWAGRIKKKERRQTARQPRAAGSSPDHPPSIFGKENRKPGASQPGGGGGRGWGVSG